MRTIDHREAIMVLNELLGVDPRALSALLRARVQCNVVLAAHPHVPIETDDATGRSTLGTLGLLNALFGIREDGRGKITAVVTDAGEVLAFTETE